MTGGCGIALDAAVVRRHDRAMNVEEINIGSSDAIAPVQAASASPARGSRATATSTGRAPRPARRSP